MRITLIPGIESAFIKEARRQRTTPEILAINYLQKRFVPSETPEPPAERQETLADFLAGQIGVLASGERVPGGARLAENSGDKFAAELVKKRQ